MFLIISIDIEIFINNKNNALLMRKFEGKDCVIINKLF